MSSSKIKYIYDIHHLLDTYPTEEDALFEITRFLETRGKLQEEWSDLGIKGAFSKRLPEDEISKLLDSLVSQGFITKREGSGKRNYFKIVQRTSESAN